MVTLHVRKVHFSMKFKTTGKVKITAGGKIYLAKFVSYTNGTGTLVTLGESNLSVFTVYLPYLLHVVHLHCEIAPC